MTESEAIDDLKNSIVSYEVQNPNNVTCDLTTEVLNMAINALEKQIPKKPEMRHTKKYDRYNDGWCPCCKSYVVEENNKNFCSECGQRLDWGD